MAPKVIVIAGPTAVGKTKFAIRAAQEFGGEIVSCDSMQLYRYMDIGSAKPTPEEAAAVPHHLVDIIDPRQPFSVAEYRRLALDAIADIVTRGRVPVVSGGTGLYLNSILYDMDFSKDPGDMEYRRELMDLAEAEGPEAVHDILKEKDPAAAELIHPNNTKRVVRALERIHDGEEQVRPFAQIREENRDYEFILVALTRDRQELYDRINRRVDQLIEAGLVEEVRSLMEMGLDASDISMKGIGYKEIMAFLEGECDLATAVDNVKKNTRHYAKKQLTWYRRYDRIYWLDISAYGDDEEAIGALLSWLRKRM